MKVCRVGDVHSRDPFDEHPEIGSVCIERALGQRGQRRDKTIDLPKVDLFGLCRGIDVHPIEGIPSWMLFAGHQHGARKFKPTIAFDDDLKSEEFADCNNDLANRHREALNELVKGQRTM